MARGAAEAAIVKQNRSALRVAVAACRGRETRRSFAQELLL
jgi:hypothetical protein